MVNTIDPLNMHFVCGGNDTHPLTTDGNTTPALVITNTVWRELEYFTKVVFKDMEYAVFLTLTRPTMAKTLWLATGFYMPKQEITNVRVDIDLEDVRNFVAQGNWHHKDLCHWHSHNHMFADWSDTDFTEQTDRSELAYADNYRFYVVVDEEDHYSCDCVVYDPFLIRQRSISVYTTGTGDGFDNALTKERKGELVQLAAEKCTRKATSYVAQQSWYDSDLDRELQQLEGDHNGNNGFDVESIYDNADN